MRCRQRCQVQWLRLWHAKTLRGCTKPESRIIIWERSDAFCNFTEVVNQRTQDRLDLSALLVKWSIAFGLWVRIYGVLEPTEYAEHLTWPDRFHIFINSRLIGKQCKMADSVEEDLKVVLWSCSPFCKLNDHIVSWLLLRLICNTNGSQFHQAINDY